MNRLASRSAPLARAHSIRARRGLALAAPLLLVLAAVPAGAAETTVTATVDARQIPMGETLSYTITIEGGASTAVPPSAPSGLTNLQVVSGASTSSRFSFVNGVVSSSKSFTWVLAPTAAGKAHIGPAAVQIGNKVYRTEAIDVDVLPAGAGGRRGPPPQARLAPTQPGREITPAELRIENELSSARVYVGQPVVVTTRLLSRVQVVDVSAGPDPTVPGFILEESDTNIVPERVFREGTEYQSYVLMKRILTPTSPGKTVIPAETRTVRVRVASRDFFDSFLMPRAMEVTRATLPITIEALGPPAAGRPESFSGAVGQFKLDTSMDRASASVGEAIGLKVTLTGNGNLKTVQSPTFAPSADFRIFDPRVDEKASGTKPRTYTKTWSYVITPLASGEIGVPTLSFTYFDPEAGAYKTLTGQAVRLSVRKGEPGLMEGAPSVASARHEVQPLQRDIRFLKMLDGPLQTSERPAAERLWVWALVGIAFVLQPAAWLVHRGGGVSSLLLGGPRGRARRRAFTELARADAAATTDGTGAAGIAWKAVLGFIADRCAVVAEGRTYEEIDQDLASRGVSPGSRADLIALLEECDRGRFSREGGIL